MSIKLPELANLDYTALDYDSIISTITDLIKNHPDYFNEVDDFLLSNAGRLTVDLVAYITDILADRIDWVANELTLPTVTQKQRAIDLMKLINYRFRLPTAASVNVTASINEYTTPFAIPARYIITAKNLDGNLTDFELLQKNSDGKYIYEGADSSYEFDTGYSSSPILSHNDLVFYEGNSHQEIYTMQGIDNEYVELSEPDVEEGSIRVWKIARDTNGTIISKTELTEVDSFISPEAQYSSSNHLPPYKLLTTEENKAILQFGESSMVETFNAFGTDEIMVWYRTTSGKNGNITPNSINYSTNLLVNGNNIRISFVNSLAGSGGSDAESLEEAKRYGPLTLTTADKTVNPRDFIVLLQDYPGLMNSITYGKSNEPDDIYEEYGYHIPPYESWIYPVFEKSGWTSFPTYSYPTTMRVGRPYNRYGILDKEKVKFESGNSNVTINKLKFYAMNNDFSNILVSDPNNKITYTPGLDYIIDLDSRWLTRLPGSSIGENDSVIVQYYESSDTDVRINFASGDSQPIPQPDIYPNSNTYAFTMDLQTRLEENTLSSNDYNYPNGDYYIDYDNNLIIKNPTYPYIESKHSIGNDINLKAGINNEFILHLEGLNNEAYNVDIDFPIETFSAWALAGSGNNISYTPSTEYRFKISIDGGNFVEYKFTSGVSGTWTTSELAKEIWDNAVDADTGTLLFRNSGAIVFADSIHNPSSPILTFMSTTKNNSASIELDHASTNDLFSLPELSIGGANSTGIGENLLLVELAARMRAKLNTLNLCTGYKGQKFTGANGEKPEVYSIANLYNPTNFSLDSNTINLDLEIKGTSSGTYDGIHNITFNIVVANSPYDLTIFQEMLNLVNDMQSDVDNSIGAQDVVEVFVLRQEEGFYRIGLRLVDDGSTTTTSYIKIIEPSNNSARKRLNFYNNQSSLDDNLVEVKVSPKSDLLTTFYLRLHLLGAFGHDAMIQVKSSNALHSNTLSALSLANEQYSRGTRILSRTLLGKYDLIDDGGYSYTFYDSGSNQNNEFTLTITDAPSGYDDGDYIITIPAGNYNINSLVEEINTAFITADYSGTPKDISSFLKCEKQEGKQRIRILMTDFSGENPDVEINNNNDADIGKLCIDKLGFIINQTMSFDSTIILHYFGNWISNEDNDNSEERAIIKYLKDKRLICQDYIVKNPIFTPIDIKGKVYCAKGFDRTVIKDEVRKKLDENFRLDKREFSSSMPISNILNVINQIEGVEYVVTEYFGKDYQLYKEYLESPKYAVIESYKPAENVVARWKPLSSFKITIDGTAQNNINYDGSYLIVVGNSWTDRDYDSLVDAISNGNGTTGGLAHAIPLSMGKSEKNLLVALEVSHSSGYITIKSQNEGPSVSIKIEKPDKEMTNGYQNFVRTEDIQESEYTPSTSYTIDLDIDGVTEPTHNITSPASGVWSLTDIAEQLNLVLPVTAKAGIDENGKVRITSLSQGNQSTINITGGTLVPLLDNTEPKVDGTSGYIDCISNSSDGSLYFTKEDYIEARGKVSEPSEDENFYNYKNEIIAKYNEILFISDDFYYGDSFELTDQTHGAILEYLEVSK